MRKITFYTMNTFLIALITLLFSCAAGLEEIVVEAYADGTPKVVRYYKGKGSEKTMIKEAYFYPDGAIRMEGEFKNSKKDGRWISYYQDGKKWSEGYYKEGINEGKTITWHETGEKYYQGSYSNGQRSGVWKFWDKDGVFLKEINYGKLQSGE